MGWKSKYTGWRDDRAYFSHFYPLPLSSNYVLRPQIPYSGFRCPHAVLQHVLCGGLILLKYDDYEMSGSEPLPRILVFQVSLLEATPVYPPPLIPLQAIILSTHHRLCETLGIRINPTIGVFLTIS
ncbi:hypothetical protein K458DRAFT_200843 [Lentithecium fluviatile CBS 122367]|uniref:Uncharacterized protein n=1 Tax=Lentithecium fluviatile CBS 122367 TaxID=1168545 RepID=A0A6G1J8V4_9PLEO|nr:hypothetical protein K458DRAFT_200843 [Lentithecium fluviatile CBS 122367]